MATFDNHRAGFGTAQTGVFGSMVQSVSGRMIGWLDARATRKSLSGLTDRELSDIGLVRGDIDAIARKTF